MTNRATEGARCRCGCTASDRAHSAACYIPGCPYPQLASKPPRAGANQAEAAVVAFPSLVSEGRDARQLQVAAWCAAAFGYGHAASVPQRGVRLAEEAIEAAQAAGCDRAMIHRLVDYVFDRPAGQLAQELGGVGVTALALAQAANLSADECEWAEVARVLSKPLSDFAARNAVKNEAGFNVGPADQE
jgi:hypothetical protein